MQDGDEFEFSRLAYQIIVADKSRKLKDVADEMGMEYATLHARLIQRAHFRPAEIRALLGIVPDHNLIGYLIEHTPFVIAERASADPSATDFMEWSHRSLFHVVDALRKIRAALDDKHIDHRERGPLLEDITEAEIALASLKAAVRADGKNGDNGGKREAGVASSQ